MKAKFENGYTITVTLRDGNLEYFVQYPDGSPCTKGWTEYREADMYDYKDEIDYLLQWCINVEDLFSEYRIVTYDKLYVFNQILDCFNKCKELDDSYGLNINENYSLFILVQEDMELQNGTLEYFIELNDTSNGDCEPCGSDNMVCPTHDLDLFTNTIFNYLKENGLEEE